MILKPWYTWTIKKFQTYLVLIQICTNYKWQTINTVAIGMYLDSLDQQGALRAKQSSFSLPEYIKYLINLAPVYMYV